MKSLYLPALAAISLLFACQKNVNNPTTPIPEDGKKYAFHLDVSGVVRESSGNFARTVDSGLLQNATMLVYSAFDANTRALKRSIIKNSADPTFGQFNDSLPRGRYLVSVAAIKDTTYSTQSVDKWAVIFHYPGTDAFYQKMIVNIDSTVNENLVLERIVSKLVINAKGRIPYNARTVSIRPVTKDPSDISGVQGTLDYFTGAIPTRTANGAYQAWNYRVADSLNGKTGLVFNTYILNPSGSRVISLSITVADSVGRPIGGKTIYDIQLETNKVTSLTGFLFDSIPATGGLGVKVNSEWKKDSILVQF